MDFDGTRLAVAYTSSSQTSVQVLLKNGLEWVEETNINIPISNTNTDTFVKLADDLLLIGETSHSADTDGAIPAAEIVSNNNASGAGAIHVYKKDADNNWNLFYQLKQSNAQGFGERIAISENPDNTTTIGAITRYDRNVTIFTRTQSDDMDSIDSQVIAKTQHYQYNSYLVISKVMLTGHYIIRY